MQCIWKSKKGL